MRITLQEINDDNEQAVRAVRTTTAQERFVLSVAYSLLKAERNQQDNPWCRAVYADEQPVGFVMMA